MIFNPLVINCADSDISPINCQNQAVRIAHCAKNKQTDKSPKAFIELGGRRRGAEGGVFYGPIGVLWTAFLNDYLQKIHT